MEPSWSLDTGDVYRLHPHQHSRQLILLYYQVCCLNPWLVQVETATCQHDSCESERRCRCVSVVTNVPVSPHQAHLPNHLQARDNDGAVTMFRAELCYKLHHSSTMPPCDCFYSLFSQPEIRSCIGSSRSASAVTTLGPDLEMRSSAYFYFRKGAGRFMGRTFPSPYLTCLTCHYNKSCLV